MKIKIFLSAIIIALLSSSVFAAKTTYSVTIINDWGKWSHVFLGGCITVQKDEEKKIYPYKFENLWPKGWATSNTVKFSSSQYNTLNDFYVTGWTGGKQAFICRPISLKDKYQGGDLVIKVEGSWKDKVPFPKCTATYQVGEIIKDIPCSCN